MMMLVERYLVICNPLAGSTFNIQQSMIASACCWLWSFIWCFLPLVTGLKFKSINYKLMVALLISSAWWRRVYFSYARYKPVQDGKA